MEDNTMNRSPDHAEPIGVTPQRKKLVAALYEAREPMYVAEAADAAGIPMATASDTLATLRTAHWVDVREQHVPGIPTPRLYHQLNDQGRDAAAEYLGGHIGSSRQSPLARVLACRGVTEEELAELLGVTRRAVAYFKARGSGVFLTTFGRYIGAVGARLRIKLDFPDGTSVTVEDIPADLAPLRRARHLTKEQLVGRMHLTRARIDKIESGHARTLLADLRDYLRALDALVTFELVFDEDDDRYVLLSGQ